MRVTVGPSKPCDAPGCDARTRPATDTCRPPDAASGHQEGGERILRKVCPVVILLDAQRAIVGQRAVSAGPRVRDFDSGAPRPAVDKDSTPRAGLDGPAVRSPSRGPAPQRDSSLRLQNRNPGAMVRPAHRNRLGLWPRRRPVAEIAETPVGPLDAAESDPDPRGEQGSIHVIDPLRLHTEIGVKIGKPTAGVTAVGDVGLHKSALCRSTQRLA